MLACVFLSVWLCTQTYKQTQRKREYKHEYTMTDKTDKHAEGVGPAEETETET